jgi:hypothetical protein
VSTGKANVSEPLMTCRKRRDATKTKLQSLAWDELEGHLFTARVVTGMKAARVQCKALV